ncbi:DMT family transporter [Lysobacter sp. MMG2]|uniref:DMT family transporter n=1 Tax=Lysobacter sp. MMG2 TaxID=2801338 RepID=UPI001C250929|nr:DMT family transporter [Lysobacter sp. MMG2]MBU8977358.1 DMT family transporter [Lysobacter sp. MMG2]
MQAQTRGAVEMTVAMTILGTIGWFVVESGQPVASVVFWRCAFGAATLLLVCAALGLFRRLTLRQWGLAIAGGAAIVANWALLFAAFPRASISVATAVYNTQPFILVLLGALFLGERLTWTKVAWLAVSFSGVLLIVQGKPGAGALGPAFVQGVALAFGAAFFYALATLATKRLAGTPPHLVALIQVGVGVLLLAPFTDFHSLPGDGRAWAFLITLGVVHTGLMYILLYGAIQKLPTHVTGALSFLYPVSALLVDFLACGHRLQPAQIVGAAAILVAAAGMNLGWSLSSVRARLRLQPVMRR